MKSVEGQTRAVTSVKVQPDSEGSLGYLVEVGGERRKVIKTSVLRDGGTTTLLLDNDSEIVFPCRINDPDRTPKLNGADIL